MLALFLVAYAAETHVTPAQAAAGVHGVDLEGKEQRFGAAGTALFAVATTTGASGAVDGRACCPSRRSCSVRVSRR